MEIGVNEGEPSWGLTLLSQMRRVRGDRKGGQDIALYRWINTVSTVLGSWRPVHLHRVRTWQKGMNDKPELSSRKRGQKKTKRFGAEWRP